MSAGCAARKAAVSWTRWASTRCAAWFDENPGSRAGQGMATSWEFVDHIASLELPGEGWTCTQPSCNVVQLRAYRSRLFSFAVAGRARLPTRQALRHQDR